MIQRAVGACWGTISHQADGAPGLGKYTPLTAAEVGSALKHLSRPIEPHVRPGADRLRSEIISLRQPNATEACRTVADDVIDGRVIVRRTISDASIRRNEGWLDRSAVVGDA